MIRANHLKRLFFGFEVHAPWPEEFPSGRMLAPSDRHMTVAFLGNVSYAKVTGLLQEFPKPPFTIGSGGIFDKCLFLPDRHPHAVAWRVQFCNSSSTVNEYQTECVNWLEAQGFSLRNAESFLPHVTLCRTPFKEKQWQQSFATLPFYIKDFHLYDNLGNSIYRPVWTIPLQSPFEVLEHKADMLFLIRGETIRQLYWHAQIALSFHYPLLTPYISEEIKVEEIEEVVTALNALVSRADQEIGCPFKAVSFHGELLRDEYGLKLEMIIDV